MSELAPLYIVIRYIAWRDRDEMRPGWADSVNPVFSS